MIAVVFCDHWAKHVGLWFFGVIGGESWTIHQDDDGSFVVGCVEYYTENKQFVFKPYMIKTSPEFDSLLWSIAISIYFKIRQLYFTRWLSI